MQSIPLAVLKRMTCACGVPEGRALHAIHTACGIETTPNSSLITVAVSDCMQSIPLAVLKHQTTALPQR